MKKDDGLLFPIPKNPSRKQILQKYAKELKWQIKKQKREIKNQEKIKKKEKIDSQIDFSKTFEYDDYQWTFTPLDIDNITKAKEKIEFLNNKMKQIAKININSQDLNLFKKDINELVEIFFPPSGLLISNPDPESNYYPKKLLAMTNALRFKAYKYFKEMFFRQFFGYSLSNSEGWFGFWGGATKKKLMVKTLKMIEQLKWRL